MLRGWWGAPFCRIGWGGRRLDETCHWGIDRSDRESAVQGEFLHLWRDFKGISAYARAEIPPTIQNVLREPIKEFNPRLEPDVGANPLPRLFFNLLLYS